MGEAAHLNSTPSAPRSQKQAPRGQLHFSNLHATRFPMTRSGGIRARPGVSPGVPGVCFLVSGYFVVVIFGVCAGRVCCVCLCELVFVWLLGCVLVVCACVGVGVCVYVCSVV
nr:MAG TPA: hypothetical protein [Caudoviricetes sp.]